MIKNVVDQMRYGVIPKHRHDRELLEFFADRIEKAVEQGIQHCGNAAKMCEALKEIREIITVFNKGLVSTQTTASTIEEIIKQALSEPPRNCDIMSLETARKIWFVKEIIPRLDGDLPLGKEVPFEDWFVSQAD